MSVNCTETVVEPGADPPKDVAEAGAADPPPPVKKPPRDDGGTSGETCWTNDPVDLSSVQWKPPRLLPGSCTNAEIDALSTFIDANQSTSIAALKASVTNTACRDCVFAPNGETWAPFTEGRGVNVSGCITVVSGSDACGRAFLNLETCLRTACEACEESESSACTRATLNGTCKASSEAADTACGASFSGLLNTCDSMGKYLIEAAARTQCVGYGDAGTGDAGGGDGGT